MTLKAFLESRLTQLKQRRMMIPRYLKSPEKFVGSKRYTEEDMKKLDGEIAETKAALEAVKKYQGKVKKTIPVGDPADGGTPVKA